MIYMPKPKFIKEIINNVMNSVIEWGGKIDARINDLLVLHKKKRR
jgi:hypothetical protein